VHYARIRERREMRKTSVQDVKRERDRFGQLDVDGILTLMWSLRRLERRAWNSVTRLWVDKSDGFSKEGKVHSCSKKCRNYVG
jgi:hypothetical protein